MSALKDVIVAALKATIGVVVEAIADTFFKPLIALAVDYMMQTPYPSNVATWGKPAGGRWFKLYNGIYDPLIMLWVPTLFGLALGFLFFTNIFNPKQKKIAIRRAVFVYPIAVGWWWFGGWVLKFTHHFSRMLAGNVSQNISDTMTSSITSLTGVALGAILLYIIGAGVLLVVIAIYQIRKIAIMGYMVGMPILLLMWIVPIDPVQNWAKSMMDKFIPLVFMVLPVALLLRIGAIFLSGGGPQLAVGGGGANLGSAITGFIILGSTALVPKYAFSFSSQVSGAVRTATDLGRATASGARAAGASRRGQQAGRAPSGTHHNGSQQATNPAPGHRRGASTAGNGGASDGTGTDQFAHDPNTDFSPSSTTTMSRRRRQHKRAAAVGKAGRELGGRAAEKMKRGTSKAGDTALESVARNYYGEGNTAVGLATDAGKSVAATASKTSQKLGAKQAQAFIGSGRRMQKINRRMRARKRELRKRHKPVPRGEVDTASHQAAEQASQGSSSGDTETDGLWSSDPTTGTRSDPAQNGNTTDASVGVNGSDRDVPDAVSLASDADHGRARVGSVSTGSDGDGTYRSSFDRNQGDRRVGSLGGNRDSTDAGSSGDSDNTASRTPHTDSMDGSDLFDTKFDTRTHDDDLRDTGGNET